MNDPRRGIPSVERLLNSEPFRALLLELPRARVVIALRDVQEHQRTSTRVVELDEHAYARAVRQRLQALEVPSLRPVINATGVVLHTNLGRAPLADEAISAIQRVAAGYSNLEYDLEAGARGSRYDQCAALLCELTGAEDALVVNNNASALLLSLNTFAAGRDAIISRGELVEIGDSFRVPDIMARSQARMLEVGATNRVRDEDYRAAIHRDAAMILKVHRSNFRITGFTADVSVPDLAELAHHHDLKFLHDLGSGLMLDLQPFGFPEEPMPVQSLAAGADLVTMSGDKLLGGPQAGIILGRRDLVAELRRNPLCRALRVDKLTMAALEATLCLYRDPAQARARIPVLRMLTVSATELLQRAHQIATRLQALGVNAQAEETLAVSGGGTFPDYEFPSGGVLVSGAGVQDLEDRLRRGEPGVLARVSEGRLVLDLRAVSPGDDVWLEQALLNGLAAVT